MNILDKYLTDKTTYVGKAVAMSDQEWAIVETPIYEVPLGDILEDYINHLSNNPCRKLNAKDYHKKTQEFKTILNQTTITITK